MSSDRFPSTFSIVAHDPENGDLGVAVQSKFIAVGAVVPWARAGVGAIATQSYANPTYGREGLELLATGVNAQQTLAALVAADEGRALRQAGIVDATGNAAAYTGAECLAWAGHIIGDGFSCQGNVLVSEATVQAMAQSFRQATGELAERLVAALAAGQAAGGDRRGQQSAALLVVRAGAGYGGADRYIDLRVDDHPLPIEELSRLLGLYRIYFGQPEPLPLTEELVGEIQARLARLGYYHGPVGAPCGAVLDEATRKALFDFAGVENLEERLSADGRWIDRLVLSFMRERGK